MGHCRLFQDDSGRGGLFGGGCGSLLCYEQKPQAPDIIFWAGGDGGGLGLFGGDGLGLLVGVNGDGMLCGGPLEGGGTGGGLFGAALATICAVLAPMLSCAVFSSSRLRLDDVCDDFDVRFDSGGPSSCSSWLVAMAAASSAATLAPVCPAIPVLSCAVFSCLMGAPE